MGWRADRFTNANFGTRIKRYAKIAAMVNVSKGVVVLCRAVPLPVTEFPCIILTVAGSRQRDTRLEVTGVQTTYLGTFESGGGGRWWDPKIGGGDLPRFAEIVADVAGCSGFHSPDRKQNVV